MRRYDLVIMEEATDGTVSTGMGASTSTTVSTDATSSDSNGFMSEDDALSFLSGYEQTPSQEQAQTTQEQSGTNEQTQSGIEFNLDDLDMSMFGLEAVNQEQQVQQTQTPQANNNELLMQQMLEKIEALNNPQVQQQTTEDELAPLRELAERMQQAGLLPKGLNKEHEELLQEVKTLRDEIKQQKDMQQQQAEYQNKINSIDAFSKELEQVIPNYNTEFMINLVAQITSKDARAGQQILNNPSMLISLWGKYGVKSQPKQQNTNVLSTNSSNNNITSSQELFDKVKSGKASDDEELRLIASL